MISPVLVALHGSHEPMILLEYLSRVALYLMAFGGIAALVLYWSVAVKATRSAISAGGGRDENQS